MLKNGLMIAPNNFWTECAQTNAECLKYKNTQYFLHIESITLNFKNAALYSNKSKKQFPCYKYLEFDYKVNKNLLCNQKGINGIIENLPCKECIELNNTNEDINVSFIPDIAFGCMGKHQMWYEINYSHPCTKEKIQFCKDKNIMLFEFDAEYILNLDINTKCIIKKPLTQS